MAEEFVLRRRTPEERDAYFILKYAELQAEITRLKAKVAEYENAITWNTSCLSCSRLLDQLIAVESERDHLRGQAPLLQEIAGVLGLDGEQR